MAGFKRILPYAAVVLAVGCRDQGLPSEPTTGPVPPPSFAIGLGSSATFNNGIDANSTFLTMTAPAVGVDDVLLAQIGLTKNINPGDKICAPTD